MDVFDSYTGRTLPIVFPKPERSYDGLTLRVSKNYSRNWMANGSYTYSVNRGNYVGPAMVDYGNSLGQGQLDPGITAAFDLPTLLSNTKGLLPSDHTHVVKLFGSYTWNFGPRFSATAGGGYTGSSGRPNSALGSHDLYGAGLSYIIPQGQAGRTPFLHQLDLRGQVGYVVRAPYEVKFSVDLLNVLNQQTILLYDQNYTANVVHPIQGASCNRSVVGAGDPGQALRDSCPDVAFMKTPDGRRVTPNLNYGKAAAGSAAYQVPIQLRFGLALTF